MRVKIVCSIALFSLSLFKVTAQTNLKVHFVDLKEGKSADGSFMKEYKPSSTNETKIHRRNKIKLYPAIEFQTIEGIGGAFNEIGGEALMTLPKKTQKEVMENLFSTTNGAGFSFCRTAVGASDFGIDAYSYSEVDGDYEMKEFSIKREKKSVIPFLQKAFKYNPDLKMFASPWSPPAWMKYSGYMDRGEEFADKNHLKDEPKIYEAYALYFSKYVKAYEKEGIKIDRLIVQNENDASTKYPSCVMPPAQMGKFVKTYLKPLFESDDINTEIWAGTFRTAEKIDAIEFAATKEYHNSFDGIGIQYTGTRYIQDMKTLLPNMPVMHTEGNCYDGKNTAKQSRNRFGEVAQYINYGVTNYCYWNMILNETTQSGWGWKQNSLINIDRENKTVTYNPDFRVIALISSYLQPGVVRVANHSRATIISVKKNNKLYVLIQNSKDIADKFQFEVVEGNSVQVEIPANSVSVIEMDI